MSSHPDTLCRRSIRLPDYNYSCTGAYFITIFTFERACLFGEILDGTVRLNEFGMIVQQSWDDLPNHFRHVQLDQFVIMPNHVHGIIVLVDDDHVGAQHAAPVFGGRNRSRAQHAAPLHIMSSHPNVIAGSLGAVVRSFKSAVTKQINTRRDTSGTPLWQRNYYEHVIRDDRDLTAIRQYVADNPAKWTDDENYPDTSAWN